MDTVHRGFRARRRHDMDDHDGPPHCSPSPTDSGSEAEPGDPASEGDDGPDLRDSGGEYESDVEDPLEKEGSPPGLPPPNPLPRPHGTTTHYHHLLDGTPCDIDGNDLPPNSSPPPREEHAMDDFSPFNS